MRHSQVTIFTMGSGIMESGSTPIPPKGAGKPVNPLLFYSHINPTPNEIKSYSTLSTHATNADKQPCTPLTKEE